MKIGRAVNLVKHNMRKNKAWEKGYTDGARDLSDIEEQKHYEQELYADIPIKIDKDCVNPDEFYRMNCEVTEKIYEKYAKMLEEELKSKGHKPGAPIFVPKRVEYPSSEELKSADMMDALRYMPELRQTSPENLPIWEL